MLKKIIKKFLYREKYSSNEYIKYLRKKGMNIGEDVTIYSPKNTIIDEQYPWLISIGNHVRITEGVIILTHDYGWSVLKKINVNHKKGVILGAAGEISIGNNVFIGMNSIILRNVNIGNNVIIGAGSVVCKNCESGWVYAGNPAKKIMTIEKYYEKRMKSQIEEARILAHKYQERFNSKPPKSIFHEFFMLFENEIPEEKVFKNKLRLCQNFEESCNYIKTKKVIFKNFEEFLEFCFKEGKN